MSGTSFRPPLRGLIYQGDSIVGGVDLSGNDEPFIEEFNREYARLGLRVQPQEVSPHSPEVSSGQELVAAAG
jgi:hypothetical protein